MTLEYVDSFDDPEMLRFKWNIVGYAGVESGVGRTGSCLGVQTNNTSGYSTQMWRQLSADSTVLMVGVAVKIPSAIQTDATMIHVWDNQNDGCFRMVYSTGGYLYFQRMSGTVNDTGVSTSSNFGGTIPISTDTWHYLELKVTHGDSSTGHITLRKNETVVADFTDKTDSYFNPSGSVSYRYYALGGLNYVGGNTYTYRRATPMRYDDLVVQRDSDAVYFGDVNVERTQPDGNGTYSQLLGADRDSTDNYVWVQRPAPPSSTSFDPTSITGLAAWYTADKVDGTNPSVVGANIAQWNDRSGNGRHLTAIGPAAYPQVQSIGTTLGVHFDGSSDLLKYTNATPFFTTTDLSVFVVAQIHNKGNVYTRVISLAGTGLDDYSNSSGFNIDSQASGYIALERNNSYPTPPGPETPTARHEYSAMWSSAGGELYMDGSLVTTNIAALPFSVNSISLGGERDGGPDYYLGGFIFEVLIYDAALTPTQRANVETYLSTRWKITAPLSFASYNTGSNSGSKRDTYSVGNPLANQGAVMGVQANALASTTGDYSLKSFIPEVVVSTALYAGSQAVASQAGSHQAFPLQVNPVTGLPWTFAQVNALEVGVRVV